MKQTIYFLVRKYGETQQYLMIKREDIKIYGHSQCNGLEIWMKSGELHIIKPLSTRKVIEDTDDPCINSVDIEVDEIESELKDWEERICTK